METLDFIHRYHDSIVIGKEIDRSFFDGLKKDIPSLSVTFYSVADIISMFSYSYSESAVSYLRYAYEFSLSIAEETLIVVSLLTKDHYVSPRLNALLSLRDELLKEGLLVEPKGLEKIFKNKNVLYFNLKSALPISFRLGEIDSNMALSFDIPNKDSSPSDPNLEKYRVLTTEEKKEIGLYF